MKLYTKVGDKGQTSLFDGTCVPKNDPRVEAYGTVDELNAVLGWCRAAEGPEAILGPLQTIQEDLFVLGAELATPARSTVAAVIPRVQPEQYQRLEAWIDEASEQAEPLKNFILPGGTELASRLHIGRTCCRRAERCVVGLTSGEGVRPELIIYLNRLGDLLFAWSRQANQAAGVPDVIWRPHR